MPLPFQFPFYGFAMESTLSIGTNGYITFGTGHFPYGNSYELPHPETLGGVNIDGMLAVMWTDINPGAAADGCGVWFQVSEEVAIVSYVCVPYWGDATTNTFQVLLYPSGLVTLQYQDLNQGGGGHGTPSIGMETAEGDAGFSAAYGWGEIPADGSAMAFVPDSSVCPCGEIPYPVCLDPPPIVYCSSFTCPAGFGLVDGATSLEGSTQAVCCVVDPCNAPGAMYIDSASVDSHTSTYGDNSVCRWSMTCSDASQVPQVVFTSFQTERNFDYVYLFEGDCLYSDYSSGSCGSANLMSQLHGDAATAGATPADTFVFGTQTGVIILGSDGSVTQQGFDAEFTCVTPTVAGMCDSFTCPAGTTNVDNAASIAGTDEATCCQTADPCASPGVVLAGGASIDSHDGNYGDDATCVWDIVCSSGQVLISFSAFDTEENWDVVYLFNGECPYADFSTTGSPPVGTCGSVPIVGSPISGNFAQVSAIPTRSRTATSGAMTVVFSSDSSVNAEGFVATTSCI